ncbi:MAG: hypothetical protein R3Y27_03895 [Clostridia bacterium]
MIIEINQTRYKLGFSFIAVLTLMLALSNDYIVVCSIIVSVLHECGHLFFMYIFGSYPIMVEFGAFGIRIEKQENSKLTYAQEAIISLGGVMVNFILCGIGFCYYLKIGSNLALQFALVNIFIASLNLMPVQMLDAGRFLKYMFLIKFSVDKTQMILEKISFLTVIFFGLFVLWYTLRVSLNYSLIVVFIYLLIIDRKWR